MSTDQRVFVTGLGASTPVGGDAASTWDGLLVRSLRRRPHRRAVGRRAARADRRTGGRRPA